MSLIISYAEKCTEREFRGCGQPLSVNKVTMERRKPTLFVSVFHCCGEGISRLFMSEVQSSRRPEWAWDTSGPQITEVQFAAAPAME